MDLTTNKEHYADVTYILVLIVHKHDLGACDHVTILSTGFRVLLSRGCVNVTAALLSELLLKKIQTNM